eukprot:NODE_930_length_3018_cov_0.368619.p1 type:complete len:354 gc:universal NODE_930_length_3018_cov_0.368619:504-1565(+)
MSIFYVVDGIVDEIYNFYYCPSCNKITQDVKDEIISQYCPNCLFDVPSLSLTQDIGKCTRSCLYCPLCQVTLSVYRNKLACCYCGYQFIEFDKPTGIGSRILKGISDSAIAKEFEKNKQYFRDFHSFQNKPNRYRIAKGPMKDDSKFELDSISPDYDEKMAFLVKQTYSSADNALFNVPNINQSTGMLFSPIINSSEFSNDYLPCRINLNTKCNVICKCGFVLTSVEPKITQVLPSLSYSANQFLPRAYAYSSDEQKVLIRMSNTQNEKVNLVFRFGEQSSSVELEGLTFLDAIPNDIVPNLLPTLFSVFSVQKYWCWIQIPKTSVLNVEMRFQYGQECRKLMFGIQAPRASE